MQTLFLSDKTKRPQARGGFGDVSAPGDLFQVGFKKLRERRKGICPATLS
jgi:hypothetical protein